MMVCFTLIDICLPQSRMTVSPTLGVEIVIVFACTMSVEPNKVQSRRQSDDEQIEWAENLRVDSVPVGFVTYGPFIVAIGTDDGKIAKRHTASTSRQLGFHYKTIVTEINLPYLFRKQQDAERNKVLRKLPKEKDGEKEKLY